MKYIRAYLIFMSMIITIFTIELALVLTLNITNELVIVLCFSFSFTIMFWLFIMFGTLVEDWQNETVIENEN